MSAAELILPTPRWALPLLKPARYKGAKGGRGSGKSHDAAERLVETSVCNPDWPIVCIREVQKSLRFSAKALIEKKIRSMGFAPLFDIQRDLIKHKRGDGVIVFEGMQDHTADSIKSLEGFMLAWVEEAHSLSARSMKLLLPTIRDEGSEIWFTWNPEDPHDPVDRLLVGDQSNDDAVVVHVNYTDNPFLPETLRKEAERHQIRDPETFPHVWLGEYVDFSDSQIFGGAYSVREFEPGADWDGPYHGLDFGFANDPTAAVKVWRHNNILFIERESGKVKLELDKTKAYLENDIPAISASVVRADSARPESISYLKRKGMPRIAGVKKWQGSVEDGITHLRAYDDIVIHPRCKAMIEEARLYRYKVDKQTGDVLPVIVDAFNHYWDAVRYAIQPLIKPKSWGAA
ncbi:MAG: PBSX family phage terminase large subunit [Pseudomonadota bacterium]